MFYKIFIFGIVGIIKGQELCSKTCASSYPLHTVDKVLELQACNKGCRLQFISFMSGKEESCESDCAFAYGKANNEVVACVQGCKEELSLADKPTLPQIGESSGHMTLHVQLLQPVFSMKRYSVDMFRNAASYFHQSTYIMERSSSDGHGNSILMHFEMFPVQDFKEIEEKVESDEKPATNSHFKHYVHKLRHHASQWLNCVEGKAGIPYPTLVGVLFFSLAMVAWICCSTCDEHDSEENERKQKKQTFSKEGLSIQADNIKDGRVFTIVAVGNDDVEKLLLA